MPNRVPGTDGVKLIKFIRALEHLVTAAVVMVTGNHEVTEQAKAADDDQVLLKSVTPNALACAVDRHVSSVRGGAKTSYRFIDEWMKGFDNRPSIWVCEQVAVGLCVGERLHTGGWSR
jgi:DNA-binding response OmpR family regulator